MVLTAAVLATGFVATCDGVGTAASAAVRLTPPNCTTAVANAAELAVSPQFTSVPGLPFDVVTTGDGRFTFVSSNGVRSGVGAVLVFRGDGSAGNMVGEVPLPSGPAGMALTDHSRLLLASEDNGIAVIDVGKAEHDDPGAVVAQVSGSGSGGIEVTPTPDGRFAFESMEDSQQVDVFRLNGAAMPHFVGAVRVGALPVGVAFSPNGKTAYVTSEEAHTGDLNGLGTLTLLRVSEAENHPRASVQRTVVAGCSPVRVVVSPDGNMVWVTARESNAVLGFSAHDLSRGTPALVSDVKVGQAPVGLALFDGGRRMLVADSARFGGGAGSLAVLDLVGRPTLQGYLPAGAFPRQMTVEPSGREIDVTNYDSSQLETVSVPSILSSTS